MAKGCSLSPSASWALLEDLCLGRWTLARYKPDDRMRFFVSILRVFRADMFFCPWPLQVIATGRQVYTALLHSNLFPQVVTLTILISLFLTLFEFSSAGTVNVRPSLV